MLKILNFDDWIDYFYGWQKDIGLDAPEFKEYRFEAKYGEIPVSEIEFGDYRGQLRWKTVMHIPDQRIRDAALNLIVYQGDTEFASVEQQRRLFETAPSRYDYLSLVRVMTEEMRHGWQMSHLLVTQFGRSGRIEAQKLLERRAFTDNRLLGAFNEQVNNWLDFFTYTQFVDRDGKFQLTMLSYSGFLPLAQSMIPMLKEESFHLGTGNNGLMRILKAGLIPTSIMQKYFNKWLPTSFDLFGTDHSSSAHWAYVWGLKGRYNERAAGGDPNKEGLNEARALSPGSREADGPPEQIDSRRPAETQGARPEIQPADRAARRQALHLGRGTPHSRRVREIFADGNALGGGRPSSRDHHEGERLDPAQKGRGICPFGGRDASEPRKVHLNSSLRILRRASLARLILVHILLGR
jgi:benzoyl-CoA 2,3-dioxygenase component B